MKRIKKWWESKPPQKTITLDKPITFKSLGLSGKTTIIPKGVYIVSGDIERIK